MGIKTKSFVEVTCDLCRTTETVEAEKPSPRLDTLGYRRVSLAIEPIHPEMAHDLRWVSPELILCRPCLKKVKETLNLSTSDDPCEDELERLKRSMTTGKRAG